MAFSLQLCLEGQHPGVASSLLMLRRVFCGYYLIKLPPNPLSILVRASLRCSVKGVVHSVIQDLQFLGNYLHGIAFISQNKNRLMSFRRKCFVYGHFEPVIKPTNADASDTQLV